VADSSGLTGLRSLETVVAVAAVYFALGFATLSVAEFANFASPVWPAAGWGLLSALMWGRRGWLGVWLGAFVQNALASPSLPWICPLLMGFGAAAQAALSARWRHQLRKETGSLDDPLKVLQFLAVVGPVACCCSATFGVSALTWFGVFAPQAYFENWAQWWVGDVLGVVALAPLAEVAFLLCSRPKFRGWLYFTPSLLTLLLTSMLFVHIQLSDRQYVEQRFHRECGLWREFIEHELRQLENELRGLQVLALRHPDWTDWRSGTRNSEAEIGAAVQAHLSGRSHGFTNVGVVCLVPGQQRTMFERLRGYPIRDVLPDRQLVPSPVRPLHHVLVYLSQSNRTLGLDAHSLPERSRAMLESASLDRVVSTGLLSSYHNPGRQDAIYLFLPVFSGAPRQPLTGFVVGAVFMQNLMDQRLGNFCPASVGYEIFVGQQKAVWRSLDSPVMNHQQQVEFGNQHWLIEFSASRDYLRANRSLQPWFVGFAGSLLASLTSVLTLLALDRQVAVDRLVEQRTARLKAVADAASRSNRAKSRFLAVMSHEIRTPLNGVLGLAHLLLRSDLSAEQREFVETMLTSGQSLLTILNDILDFSKIESDRLELETRPLDLVEVCEEVLELFTHTAQEKGLELSLSPIANRGGETSTLGDPTRLRQVLLNLVGNALKFSSCGEVVVEIEYLPEASRWRLGVRDQGIGLDHELRERIFEPFSQADSSIARRYGGTGLGLAISRGLVERMGGELCALPNEPQGSLFQFEIPDQPCAAEPLIAGLEQLPFRLEGVDLKAREERLLGWLLSRLRCSETGPVYLLGPAPRRSEHWIQLLETGQQPESDLVLQRPLRLGRLRQLLQRLCPSDDLVGQTVSARQRPRILLAEDNAVNQKVALKLLENLGYEADLARDGLEALEMAARESYGLILMDIQMPRMDGLEAMRQLRQRGHQGPILALTALAGQEDEAACRRAGADEFMSKPLHPERLQQMIDRLIGSTL